MRKRHPRDTVRFAALLKLRARLQTRTRNANGKDRR
jgi:hypothetical protein